MTLTVRTPHMRIRGRLEVANDQTIPKRRRFVLEMCPWIGILKREIDLVQIFGVGPG